MVKLQDGREFNEKSYDPRYKYNMYVCSRGHQVLSCDLDMGVTPMFVTCRRGGLSGCGLTGESQMYPAGPPNSFNFPVELVWRKPTKGELRRARRDNFIDYFDKGGLQMEWIHG